MRNLIRNVTIILLLLCFSRISFAADSTRVSFQKQNKKNRYISLSFGMGVGYSNNQSLKQFIEYRVPNYGNIPESDKLTGFSTGLEFFGGVERQFAKNFSARIEYAYFIKSMNSTNVIFNSYDFSYISHQPYLILNYIIPLEYSFLKFGAGAGYFFSIFKIREGSIENTYKSNSIGLKLEGVINLQISKNFAGYLSGFINKTFANDLKDKNDVDLVNVKGEKVNLSSFGVGLRLGVEVFIF